MKEKYPDTAAILPGKNRVNVKEVAPSFTSITRQFLSSPSTSELRCPRCGELLNFSYGTEWIGPDSFTCRSCDQLISISLIHRALRDLGIK